MQQVFYHWLWENDSGSDPITNHDKGYVATFQFGKKTDTLDIWGKVLKEEKTSFITEEVKEKLKEFQGEVYQLPPMY